MERPNSNKLGSRTASQPQIDSYYTIDTSSMAANKGRAAFRPRDNLSNGVTGLGPERLDQKNMKQSKVYSRQFKGSQTKKVMEYANFQYNSKPFH